MSPPKGNATLNITKKNLGRILRGGSEMGIKLYDGELTQYWKNAEEIWGTRTVKNWTPDPSDDPRGKK